MDGKQWTVSVNHEQGEEPVIRADRYEVMDPGALLVFYRKEEIVATFQRWEYVVLVDGYEREPMP